MKLLITFCMVRFSGGLSLIDSDPKRFFYEKSIFVLILIRLYEVKIKSEMASKELEMSFFKKNSI